MKRGLSLYSGIEGIGLGLEKSGFCKVVAQVEIDEYCQKINTENFPKARRWRDICTVTANDIRRGVRTGVDIIFGGFPCQDISTAGQGAGLGGARSGLWREMWRLVRDLRPAWVFIENVPALRTRGADNVLAGLEALGNTSWPLVVGAWAAGAGHLRERVCILSQQIIPNTDREHGSTSTVERQRSLVAASKKRTKLVGDGDSSGSRSSSTWSDSIGGELRHESGGSGRSGGEDSPEPTANTGAAEPGGRGLSASVYEKQHDWEEPRVIEPSLALAIHGIPSRLAIKAIGNSYPPPLAEAIGRTLVRYEEAIKMINGEL